MYVIATFNLLPGVLQSPRALSIWNQLLGESLTRLPTKVWFSSPVYTSLCE